VDRGSGINYNLHVNSKDTNGVIVRYYWDERSVFDSTTLPPERKTADSLFSRTIGAVEVNQGWPIWIYARDDDGLVRGGRFVVFADSAPRPIVAAYNSPAAPGKFSWSGLDAKDSLATEYRILVKKGSAPDTSATSPDTAKNWTPGSAAEFWYTPGNAKPFSWTYTPTQGTGTYFYQIVARDKRGTKSYSSNALNFDY
jgi:hypothetical protein